MAKTMQNLRFMQNSSQSKPNRSIQIDHHASYDAGGEETEEDVRYKLIPKCILAGPAMSSEDESIMSENIIPLDRNRSKHSSLLSLQDSVTVRGLNCSANTTHKATETAISLLHELKSLWLNVSAVGLSPSTTALCGGDYRLTHLLDLCSFIVKEMQAEWKSLISNQTDVARVKELQEANHLLIEQLEHSRTIQSCLESELDTLVKEKVFMLDEIKELSVKGVVTDTRNIIFNSENNPVANKSESSTSFGFNVDAEELNANIKKRENDFDSIMEAVKERDNEMNFYHEQLEKYDKELTILKKQIEDTVIEKTKLQESYQKVLEEKDTICNENEHYEIILKLILDEKQNEDHNLHKLFTDLMEKLNTINLNSSDPEDDKKGGSKLAMIESALLVAQEQNAAYRIEVKDLRDNLKNISTDFLNCKKEVDESNEEFLKQIGQLETYLNRQCEELEHQKTKYNELQGKYDKTLEEKEKLRDLLARKESELERKEESYQNIQKSNLKLQKKLQDTHKSNVQLNQELDDYKQNMTDLNDIISQLRANLREQKIQWTERLRAGAEEITQSKLNCKWLQSQVEHLNNQLVETNQRLKANERDKSCLAHQVLSAEEERKLIDRKLFELRTAFHGDTVLRDALMERNEALQAEINRLRKSNLMNMEVNNNFPEETKNKFSTTSISGPESEYSGTDTLSPYNTLSLDLPKKTKTLETIYINENSSTINTNNVMQEKNLHSVASAQVPFERSNRKIQ